MMDEEGPDDNIGEKANGTKASEVYLSLNEFHLVQLKNILSENGLQCVLNFGMLSYKDKVFVKRNDNQISLEGIFCAEYYKIRAILYKYLGVNSR